MPQQPRPHRGCLSRLGTALAGVFWNGRQRRLRTLWRLGVMLLLLFLASRFTAALFDWLGWEPGTAIGTLLPVALAMAVAAPLLDRRRLSDYGLSFDRNWLNDVAFGLFLGASLMALIFVIEWAAGWIRITETFVPAVSGQSFLQGFLGPLALFIAVGFAEEMLFRGYLLSNLAQGLNSRFWDPRCAVCMAYLSSSIVFALAHLGNPSVSLSAVLSLCIAGLFLGLAYVLSGSLAISIGLHISWNLFEGAVFGFPVSGLHFPFSLVLRTTQMGPEVWTGGAFGPEGGLVALACELLGMLAILIWVWGVRGEVGLKLSLAEFRPTKSTPRQE